MAAKARSKAASMIRENESDEGAIKKLDKDAIAKSKAFSRDERMAQESSQAAKVRLPRAWSRVQGFVC